jgi:DNA-binding transcriptional MocR family regulator
MEYYYKGTGNADNEQTIASIILGNSLLTANGVPVAGEYEIKNAQAISIAPGRMFTLQNQFQNCMRLSIGLPWTNDLKVKLKQLGSLAEMI